MSTDMANVVQRLQGDWQFIADFLDDPVSVLSGFSLSDEEHRALGARDARALMALGLEQQTVYAAVSGDGHSRVCSKGCKPGWG